MLPQQAGAEFAYAGAEIAQHVFIAVGDDLDAARVAAKGAAHRKRQRVVDEGIDRLRRIECTPARRKQCVADLAAYRLLAQRCRQRAAGAPEAHAQGRLWLGPRIGLRHGWVRLYRRLPGGAGFLDRREDRDEMREPADREDLVHDRVEPGRRQPPLSRLLPRGGHQRAQPGARNIFDPGKINDDVGGAGGDGGKQPRLKLAAREVVDAPDRSQYQDVRLAPLADIHGSPRRIGARTALSGVWPREARSAVGPAANREKIAKYAGGSPYCLTWSKSRRRKPAHGLYDHPYDGAHRGGGARPRPDNADRRGDAGRPEPRFFRSPRAGDPRSKIRAAAIHRGGGALRRASAARQKGAARPRLPANVLCFKRADGTRQTLHLGRDVSYRSLQSSGAAQGDDAVSGLAAEHRRRHPVR